MIDLRSDTVTRPSPAMRRAMAEAEVGDDWFGDDPTVNRLQERAAALTGKEAALFCASGTMANQIALRTFVRPGHEYVAGPQAHVASTELHAAASVSGVIPRPAAMTADGVAAALQPDAYRMRAVDLVCVENTSQAGGGSVLSPEALGAIRAAADAVGVPLYLDGARIFNAAAASGTEVGAFAAEAEALMFSVSKGLGAPVGSLLCGPAPLIEEARRIRLQLGGGWRQAGVLAAAALVALEEGPPLLPGDHERARRLAEGIAEATPGAVDPDRVETNIVYLDVQDGAGVVARLSERGVRAGFVGGRVRMVTHRDVDDRGIDAALEAWRAVSARRGA